MKILNLCSRSTYILNPFKTSNYKIIDEKSKVRFAIKNYKQIGLLLILFISLFTVGQTLAQPVWDATPSNGMPLLLIVMKMEIIP